MGSEKEQKECVTVSVALRNKLNAEVRHRCLWCGDKWDAMNTLVVHHIEPNDNTNSTFKNLIALCANHHNQHHYGLGITPDPHVVKRALQYPEEGVKMGILPDYFLEKQTQIKRKRKITKNFQQVSIEKNSGVVAQTIGTININKKPDPLPETIGASADHKNYVVYLIKRYAKFLPSFKSRVKIKNFYSAAYGRVEKVLRAPALNKKLKDFDFVCRTIKAKIETTPAAKRNKRLGIHSYRTFEEYLILGGD